MPALIPHFINGKLISPANAVHCDVYNPATGNVIRQAGIATHEEINQAVQAAKQAFPAWSATPALKRARIFFNYKNLIEKHYDELAQLVTEEHGKLLSDAKGSIQRGLEVVELACNIPYLLKGWFSENVATNVDCHTIRQPLGVCVGITPFNFPAMIPLWMFPMAIACGNTFVLKPSEKNPSCPLRLCQLLQEAGLPDGVLNLVNGTAETVQSLVTHNDVAAVSFVGSTKIGKIVQQTATQHGKRVQAFGSAKNHCIVMPDADIASTADAIVGAAFGSAGERCMALSVVVTVGDDVANQLVQHLKPKIENLKIVEGKLDNGDLGPLVSKAHLQNIKNHIQIGVDEKAKLVVDGRNFQLSSQPQGFFLGGCLFDHVQPDMRIYQEEIFGPVLCVVRCPDFDSALELINRHPYGNGTAIFTNSGYYAREFSSRVQVGMVGVNVPIPVPAPFHAFGGWKGSVMADVNMHGSESVNFYTHLKTITTRWPKENKLTANFMMPTHD